MLCLQICALQGMQNIYSHPSKIVHATRNSFARQNPWLARDTQGSSSRTRRRTRSRQEIAAECEAKWHEAMQNAFPVMMWYVVPWLKLMYPPPPLLLHRSLLAVIVKNNRVEDELDEHDYEQSSSNGRQSRARDTQIGTRGRQRCWWWQSQRGAALKLMRLTTTTSTSSSSSTHSAHIAHGTLEMMSRIMLRCRLWPTRSERSVS